MLDGYEVRRTKNQSASPSSLLSIPLGPFCDSYFPAHEIVSFLRIRGRVAGRECWSFLLANLTKNAISSLYYADVLSSCFFTLPTTACPFYKPASYFHTVISEIPPGSNMLKCLTWFLSLSSLFALSRPGNGALLPPPGARSIPILKRDGAQLVRRQDCAAPGLEVDQEQVTHTPSNPYKLEVC